MMKTLPPVPTKTLLNSDKEDPYPPGSDEGDPPPGNNENGPPPNNDEDDPTGGKGSITQWVHAEYMEGSETIHLTFTQWVRGGYFSKVPTKDWVTL